MEGEGGEAAKGARNSFRSIPSAEWIFDTIGNSARSRIIGLKGGWLMGARDARVDLLRNELMWTNLR